MTPSELLELAGIVYPDKEWCRPILPGHPDYGDGKDTEADYVAYFDYDGPEDLEIHFNPSLTGEDWQKAQALDVIVAAFALDGPFQITGQDDHHFGVRVYSAHYRFEKDGIRLMGDTGPEYDILTASAMALLADRGKG